MADLGDRTAVTPEPGDLVLAQFWSDQPDRLIPYRIVGPDTDPDWEGWWLLEPLTGPTGGAVPKLPLDLIHADDGRAEAAQRRIDAIKTHAHKWERSGWVIDTYPEQHTWHCDCGAATHDPETGHLCWIAHP